MSTAGCCAELSRALTACPAPRFLRLVLMKACLLHSVAPVETNPLVFTDTATPKPGRGEVLVRVRACAVCRTDLHVIEGELPPRKSPLIPGHQVVGMVAELGEGAHRFRSGARVGIAWLHHTDQVCEYCRRGMENLCDQPAFTGYTVDGGYAEYALRPRSGFTRSPIVP